MIRCASPPGPLFAYVFTATEPLPALRVPVPARRPAARGRIGDPMATLEFLGRGHRSKYLVETDAGRLLVGRAHHRRR